MSTRFGWFVSAVRSTVDEIKVVAGVENWKQEIERMPDEYDGIFGG